MHRMRFPGLIITLPGALLLGLEYLHAQEDYRPSDFLPLQVGNSWTYFHSIGGNAPSENRVIRGDVLNHPFLSDSPHHSFGDEFTISVEGAEVIDGKTYYALSDVSRSWPPLPPHFIAGKKLRWEGDALLEHTEDGERAVFQLFGTVEERSYSIAVTEGDRRVSVRGGTSAVPWQWYELTGDRLGFRRARFLADFGMVNSTWVVNEFIDEDGIYFGADFHNILVLVEATIQGRTIDYDDALWARGDIPDITTPFFSVQEGDVWILSRYTSGYSYPTRETVTVTPTSEEIDGRAYWRLEMDPTPLWGLIGSFLACRGSHFRVDERGRIWVFSEYHDEITLPWQQSGERDPGTVCESDFIRIEGKEILLYDFDLELPEIDPYDSTCPGLSIPLARSPGDGLRSDRISFSYACAWSEAPTSTVTFHRGLGIRRILVSSCCTSSTTRYNPLWMRVGGREWGIHPGPDFVGYDIETHVAVVKETPPEVVNLGRNFPNPFNSVTHLSYAIATDGLVSFVVYNLLGQPVQTLVNEFQRAGFYDVSWYPSKDVAAGIYVYRLTTDNGSLVGRMTYLP